jgi:hypothetical protein
MGKLKKPEILWDKPHTPKIILNLCGFANANLLRFSDAERLSLQTQTVAVYHQGNRKIYK